MEFVYFELNFVHFTKNLSQALQETLNFSLMFIYLTKNLNSKSNLPTYWKSDISCSTVLNFNSKLFFLVTNLCLCNDFGDFHMFVAVGFYIFYLYFLFSIKKKARSYNLSLYYIGCSFNIFVTVFILALISFHFINDKIFSLWFVKNLFLPSFLFSDHKIVQKIL